MRLPLLEGGAPLPDGLMSGSSGRRRAFPSVLLAALVVLGTTRCDEPAELPDRRVALDLLRADRPRAAVETRFFRFGEDPRLPLGEGWSRDERNRESGVTFVWATRRRATMNLDVLQVTDLQVLFKARGFPLPKPQTTSVEVNGQTVATFEMPPLFREYRFVVDADDLRPGRNELAFVHRELGQTETRDPRTFAAAYAWIMAGPLCLPLRAHGDPAQPSLERKDDTSELAVLGPAELAWDVSIPPGSWFHAALELPEGGAGAAEAVLQIRRRGQWEELTRQRLRRPWIQSETRRILRAPIPESTDDTTGLRLRILPVRCRSATTRVVVEKAAIVTGNAL